MGFLASLGQIKLDEKTHNLVKGALKHFLHQFIFYPITQREEDLNGLSKNSL